MRITPKARQPPWKAQPAPEPAPPEPAPEPALPEPAPPEPPKKRRRRRKPRQYHEGWAPLTQDLELPPPPDGMLLSAIQAQFKVEIQEGSTTCPLCGRYAAIKPRALNATMARGLIWLVRQSGAERRWVNVQEEQPEHFKSGKQTTTLRLWHLVEKAPKGVGVQKSSSGLWRPTDLGIDFAYSRAKIPRTVYEYSSQVLAYSAEEWKIQGALGKKFNYWELMGWKPEDEVCSPCCGCICGHCSDGHNPSPGHTDKCIEHRKRIVEAIMAGAS